MRDRYAPEDPEWSEELALMLGDPLPLDWRDPQAAATRQELLATAARAAGDAAREYAALRLGLDEDHPQGKQGAAAFGTAMAVLYRARQRYIRETQRSDAGMVIMDALSTAVGEDVAAFVDGVLDNLLREPPESFGSQSQDR
jgi:hypothetical protein